MTRPTLPRWANRKDAADYVGVSEDTIDNWIKRGHITRHNAGRLVRLDLNEIDAYLRANTAGLKADRRAS